MKVFLIVTCLFCFVHQTVPLIPPKFQWKTIDFAWDANNKKIALTCSGDYVAENVMPTGIARWKDKLFIAIPRWKNGVPASLNYVYLNGTQNEPLQPYPSWKDAFVQHDAKVINSNATVVSAFRMHVDRCDRLWVVDNGLADMSEPEVRQISDPAVIVFDLKTDSVVRRLDLTGEVLKDSSVLTSVVSSNVMTDNLCGAVACIPAGFHGVAKPTLLKRLDIGRVADIGRKDCDDAYAYITDSGSNAIIVYSMKSNEAWRVENHYFQSDPHASAFKVGGIDFCGNEGVSAAALAQVKCDGIRDLYLHPMSSTKQFKMSTQLLKDKDAPKKDISNGVMVVGEKGPLSQASACDFDPKTNVLFFTQVCKNAVSCWNIEKPYTPENTPTIVRDCNLLEYPNDVKVDSEGNLWILSNRQARFLKGCLDPSQVNFRVLSAPVAALLQGSTCEKPSLSSRAWSALGIKSKK